MSQRHDLFPAEVFLPDGRLLLKARVIVEPDGQARVWEVRGGEPCLTWTGRVMLTVVPQGKYAPAKHRRLEAEVLESSGTIHNRLRVTNVGGCICGGIGVLQRIPGVDT